MTQKNNQQKNKGKLPKRMNKSIYILVFLLVLIVAIFLLRPGVYTIQPTNTIPDGVTILYLLREPEMPFYTSLHPECAYSATNVSIMCTATLRTASENLSGRIIMNLPYNHTTDLKGSNGVEPGIYEEDN